eukprot:314698_1
MTVKWDIMVIYGYEWVLLITMAMVMVVFHLLMTTKCNELIFIQFQMYIKQHIIQHIILIQILYIPYDYIYLVNNTLKNTLNNTLFNTLFNTLVKSCINTKTYYELLLSTFPFRPSFCIM